MFKIEYSLKDIKMLKAKLLFLIQKKQGNLADTEVVNINKVLQEALTQYDKVLE